MVRRSLPLLLFAYLGSLIVVSQLDAVTDWGMLRTQLLMTDGMRRALILVTIVGLWAAICSAGLRIVWQSPEHRWLLRQPVSSWGFGLAWILITLPALPPVAAWTGLVAPATASGGVNLILTLFAAGTLMLALAVRRWLLVVGALVVLSVIGLSARAGLWANLLIAVLALPLLPLLGRFGRIIVAAGSAHGSWRLVPVGPVSAAVYRDLLLAVRGRTLSGTLTMMILSTAFLWALVHNGQIVGRDALIAATILLSIALWPAYESLEKVQLRLSPAQRFPGRWPLSDGQRLAALLGSALCLTVPAALLMLLVSARALGVGGSIVLITASLCLACCISLFLLLRELWYPHSSAVGAFLFVLIAVTILITLLPWSAPAAGLGFLGAGALALRRLFYG